MARLLCSRATKSCSGVVRSAEPAGETIVSLFFQDGQCRSTARAVSEAFSVELKHSMSLVQRHRLRHLVAQKRKHFICFQLNCLVGQRYFFSLSSRAAMSSTDRFPLRCGGEAASGPRAGAMVFSENCCHSTSRSAACNRTVVLANAVTSTITAITRKVVVTTAIPGACVAPRTERGEVPATSIPPRPYRKSPKG